MRYFTQLAYNGTLYFGWQIQPNQITIQEVLENAFSLLLKEKISITGCGRTDTGVHALIYYAHFDTEKDFSADTLTHKLNNFLPKDIVIKKIWEVLPDNHARFDAIERTYRYFINLEKDPFNTHFSYRVFESLDVTLMNDAAKLLIETQDFTSFSKTHTQVNNNLCHVSSAFWTLENNQLIFEISANRFLRNMVRAIVGTLLLVGKKKIDLIQFQDIINQKDRQMAGISVPAHALFLVNVRYPFLNQQ